VEMTERWRPAHRATNTGRNVTLAFTRALLIAALAFWFAYPAYSGVGIDIRVAPPPPVVEAPPPRVGFVWAPGFWRWEGHRHVWVAGHWMHERPGYRWAPDHWAEHHGRYHYEPGHWER
jgi:WXXGXW repeat (2 copies)